MFLGSYVNKLDKKGRLSLPAPFRFVLQGQCVLTPSPLKPCVEGFAPKRMEKIMQQLDKKDFLSDDYSALAIALFSSSEIVSYDKDGRFSVQSAFCEHMRTSLDKALLFVGFGSVFQIWREDLFAEYKNSALKHLEKNPPSLILND
ncbi:MAG: hypothetical protein OXC30_00900 [Alphaproteobacteria bacterium]|nr:hypothetical protein [Alphaproteobacteria bacterium]